MSICVDCVGFVDNGDWLVFLIEDFVDDVDVLSGEIGFDKSVGEGGEFIGFYLYDGIKFFVE